MRTLIDINAFRGFLEKSVRRVSSPMRASASGNCFLNHLRKTSGELSRSNSDVGAKRVQVKVLS